jgi:opacity protein-like surface antigen
LREVGGRATTNSTGTVNSANVFGNNVIGSTNCTANVRQEYGGVQAGVDLGKLNWAGGGADVHYGITAGYAASSGHDNAAPTSLETQASFVGGYGTLAYGDFFADLMIRRNFYQIEAIEAPILELHNGRFKADGTSVSGNIGYNIPSPGSTWFVEPSAGFVYSVVKLDQLTIPGNIGIHGLVSPGVIQFDDVKSTLGRLGVRVGTNVSIGNVAVQPFVTASVWHEFEGPAVSTFNGNFNDLPTTFQVSNSRLGTYGQYSIGAAAQLANSGWAGYARLDVREGSNIEGVGINAGLRYTFDAEPTSTGAPSSAKARSSIKGHSPIKVPTLYKAPPKIATYLWTGCYLGPHGGYGWGTSNTDAGNVSHRIADETPADFSSSPHGGITGAQLGCNYQSPENWVVGIEGEGWRSWMNDTASAFGHEDRPLGADLHTLRAQNMWDAALSLRLGIAVGQALLYAKGGGAYGSFQYVFIDAADFHDFDVNSSKFGWLVGVGVEYPFTQNWSAKVEYDYLNFGNNNVSTFLTGHEIGPNINVTGTPFRFAVSETKNIIKAGLNFKLQ